MRLNDICRLIALNPAVNHKELVHQLLHCFPIIVISNSTNKLPRVVNVL